MYLGGNLGFKFSFFWGVIIVIVLVIGGSWLVLIFDLDFEVIEVVIKYLLIMFISYGIFGIMLIFSVIFNVLGKFLFFVMMSFIRVLFLYVFLIYLGSWLLGINGIFYGICFVNLVVGIGVYFYFNKIFKFNN